jgi:hypothetical protein
MNKMKRTYLKHRLIQTTSIIFKPWPITVVL